MRIKNCLIVLMLVSGLLVQGAISGTGFESISKRQIASITLDKIKNNLKGKGAGLDYRELFDKAIAEEKCGFMGYHGDSLDFLIYEDIIRCLVEEVTGKPVRKDFHFVSIPHDKNVLLSLEDLSVLFVQEGYDAKVINESTFSLNFAMYDNHNRLGLNSVVHFSKNLNYTTSPKNDLKQLFQSLGVDPQLVDKLFEIGYQRLDSKTGVLLQFFDLSPSPYAFANAISYASYPNGFIAENRLISEYFLDSSLCEFPHELRIILNVRGILNPTSPLVVKRYTKIQPSKLKAWEQDLRAEIEAASFDRLKCENWKQFLLQAWIL